MKILFISDGEPTPTGSVTRDVYDILFAYQGNEIIYLAVVNKESSSIEYPSNVHFIPWSTICQNKKSKLGVFKWPLVRREWLSYNRMVLNMSEYDYVITFPSQISLLDFGGFKGKVINFACDSSTMVYLRGFTNHKSIIYKFLFLIRLLQTIRLDRISSKKSDMIFTVGKTDADAYSVFFNKQAFMVPNQVTTEVQQYNACTWDSEQPLKLCFAGSLPYYYTADLFNDILNEFVNQKAEFTGKIHFTFLGNYKKKVYNKLQKAGYTVEICSYADSFEEFLSNQHILMVPLSVGGGCKNRVLTTIGLGLDFIGTDIACENIYGVQQENRANTAKEFVEQVRLRLNNKHLYSYSPDEHEKFMHYHDRSIWEKKFWDIL